MRERPTRHAAAPQSPYSPSKKGSLRTSVAPWPLVAREKLADFKIFKVRKDLSRSPRTGIPHPYFVLDSQDWVNVVAITKEKRIVLVRQFRAGSGTVTLEIPGGGVEKKDRSPLVAARRELREETGYVARRWKKLGVVQPNPAIQSNVCTTYLAMDCTRAGDPAPDGAEELSVELHRVSSIDRLVRSSRIRHALVLAAFHWYGLRGAAR